MKYDRTLDGIYILATSEGGARYWYYQGEVTDVRGGRLPDDAMTALIIAGARRFIAAEAAEKKAAAEAKEAAELAAYEAARRNTTEGKARAYTRDMLEGGEGYNPYYR
jgi:hypothetical protein